MRIPSSPTTQADARKIFRVLLLLLLLLTACAAQLESNAPPAAALTASAPTAAVTETPPPAARQDQAGAPDSAPQEFPQAVASIRAMRQQPDLALTFRGEGSSPNANLHPALIFQDAQGGEYLVDVETALVLEYAAVSLPGVRQAQSPDALRALAEQLANQQSAAFARNQPSLRYTEGTKDGSSRAFRWEAPITLGQRMPPFLQVVLRVDGELLNYINSLDAQSDALPALPVPANPAPDSIDRQPQTLAVPAAGLVIDAYRLKQPFSADEWGYQQVLENLQAQSRLARLPQGEYVWRTAEMARQAEVNHALAPFGYRLAYPAGAADAWRGMELFHGQETLLKEIIGFGSVSVNASETDFFLMFETAQGKSRYFLLRAGGLEPWPAQDMFLNVEKQQYLGDTPFQCEIHRIVQPTPANASTPQAMPEEYIRGFSGGELVGEIQAPFRAGSPGYIGCWTYAEHWAAEVIDSIIIDGQPVNTRFGYDTSYEFHLIEGKPLFFYEKEGALGINFDGQEIPLPWQAIFHYGCCSASMHNPVQLERLLVFFARQDQQVYYVELELE